MLVSVRVCASVCVYMCASLCVCVRANNADGWFLAQQCEWDTRDAVVHVKSIFNHDKYTCRQTGCLHEDNKLGYWKKSDCRGKWRVVNWLLKKCTWMVQCQQWHFPPILAWHAYTESNLAQLNVRIVHPGAHQHDQMTNHWTQVMLLYEESAAEIYLFWVF